MHFLLRHVGFVNQKPAELEVLTVQGSGCEGHAGWPCQQASTRCFGPLIPSSLLLQDLLGWMVKPLVRFHGYLFYNVTVWVRFFQGSSFPSSDARW